MSKSTPSTPRSSRNRGFGNIELLVAFAIVGLGISLATGMLHAGKSHIQRQERETETTGVGRAALDAILRELRLSGACLPETGEFIALEATDGGTRDEVVTRYGLTSDHLTCIQTTTTATITNLDRSLAVTDTLDMVAGMTVYMRNTNGSGEYFTLTGVDTENQRLTIDRSPSLAYPPTSGIYAIDERRFFIDDTADEPRLMLQIGRDPAQPFAIGIDRLDIQYETADGVVTAVPGDHAQWRAVRQIHLSLGARSVSISADGTQTRRDFQVTIQPRNLIAG